MAQQQPSEQSPAPEKRPSRWRFTSRELRMLVYLLILAGVAGWRFLPRPWSPALTLETPHHVILSTATRPQTEEIAHALGLLYDAYSNRFGIVAGFQREHPKLKLKLFKDRAEFRRVNPNVGWAEAF